MKGTQSNTKHAFGCVSSHDILASRVFSRVQMLCNLATALWGAFPVTFLRLQDADITIYSLHDMIAVVCAITANIGRLAVSKG